MNIRSFLTSTAVIALAIAAWPASSVLAQDFACNPANGECSRNTVVRNIPLDSFKEDDIGFIVSLVFRSCQTDNTKLPNPPYRRISNFPNSKEPAATGVSTGDARHDLVVWDSQYSKGSTPSLSGSDVQKQIGISPGVTLSADVLNSSNVLTITDTTVVTDQMAAQLVDAGTVTVTNPATDQQNTFKIGGFDAAVIIKNGQPKTADLICDVNMWYLDGGQIKYGFKGYNFGQPVNRMLLMWLMGPSSMGSGSAISAACSAMNANGAVPLRDYDLQQSPLPYTNRPAAVPPGEDPVSSYKTGAAYLREVETVGASGSAPRIYGDPQLPVNLTSCRVPAGFCDTTEPIPTSGLSGNSCNPKAGTASPPSISAEVLNAGNASFCKTDSTGSTTCFSF